ncbi:MAG: zf-TFIIB domain-containing protein [Proteobacteria bacterium]|nr:zf-TFIIB domain-containing protein [Pseudomonadota bacterium]
MNCPKKCESADFRPMDTQEGVTVDFYSGCKGLWFDKGELAFYVETSEDLPSKRESDAEARETDFACPKCPDQKLLEMPYQPGAELLIDSCGQCQGIFLDNRELPKLEALARDVEPVGKVFRTVQKLQDQGFLVLGGSVHQR